jgi:class 3 adenylate cyclase
MALNESMGDARWMEVLHVHNAVIEHHVARQGGRVVKTIGDGYMVVFARPQSGVRCALAIQAALGTRDSELETPSASASGCTPARSSAKGRTSSGAR